MTRSRKSGYELSDEETEAAAGAGDAVTSFRLLVYAGQRLRYLLDQRLRTEGLTTQQGILLTLVRTRGRPTLGEVTKAMATSHQNARQIAAALERKGMLTIATDSSDARVRRLQATEAGKSGWTDRNREDYAAIAGWFAGLTATDQAQLAKLLEKLVHSLPSGRDAEVLAADDG